jgi:hypothetical protein
MSTDPQPCVVRIDRQSGGLHRVKVEARTLWEAMGLAIVEFRKQGKPIVISALIRLLRFR